MTSPVPPITLCDRQVLCVAVNDLAILKLATPIDFSRYTCIRPLCLPPRDQEFPLDSRCQVAGWGVIREDDNIKSLRKTAVATGS